MPWYYYVDEAMHRLGLTRSGTLGGRFCDWVDRQYDHREDLNMDDEV